VKWRKTPREMQILAPIIGRLPRAPPDDLKKKFDLGGAL
jgi:hypothetical protein